MTSINVRIIEDRFVIDTIEIPVQFCIQNWGEPFDRKLLKNAVKMVLSRDNLDISKINKIVVVLELIKYSSDESPNDMPDTEIELPLEDGQIETVAMSDRFTYAMEDIVIVVSFKDQKTKCFAITSPLLVDMERYMPLNHVDYTVIKCK